MNYNSHYLLLPLIADVKGLLTKYSSAGAVLERSILDNIAFGRKVLLLSAKH